jgi:hypothetical protein
MDRLYTDFHLIGNTFIDVRVSRVQANVEIREDAVLKLNSSKKKGITIDFFS